MDRLSNGRFLFGIGGGWNAEEMANHGTRFRRRWRLMRERVLAMKEIWTKDEPEFHGEFVDFDKMWAWPKPVQQPHPRLSSWAATAPLHSTGSSNTPTDGCPSAAGPPKGPSLPEKIALLRRQAEEAGRDPASISVSIFGTPRDEGFIRTMEAAGVDRLVFGLPSAERDEVTADH